MARALEWKDLAALHRFQNQRMFLDNVLRLTYNPGLFSSSLLSILTETSGFCTAVEPLDSDRYPYLVGQLFHVNQDQSARIALLAPGDLDHPGYSAILDQLVARAGEGGALQILGEVDQNSLADTIITRAGFRPYAEQQIWKMPRKLISRTGKKTWVPLPRADTNQVDLFCQRYVPPPVQRVETMAALATPQGLVCWNEGSIVGVALTSFGPRGVLIDLVLHPDLSDLHDYLNALFLHLPYRTSLDIYLRVRSYQQRIASALEIAGANPGPEQKAVVKRLALHYNAKQTFRVQGFENQPDITTPISNTKVEI